MEIQKNMCSNRPVVVGLAGVLPEGVNNLIWGFVGFQSKATKELKEHFEKHRDYGERWLRGMVDPNFDEVRYRLWCIHGRVLLDARQAKVDKKHGWIGRFIYEQFDGRISKKRDLICKVKFERCTKAYQPDVLRLTTWGRKQNAITV
jgi:hypothetical protein